MRKVSSSTPSLPACPARPSAQQVPCHPFYPYLPSDRVFSCYTWHSECRMRWAAQKPYKECRISDGWTDLPYWLVSSAIRLSSLTPLATSSLASSRTPCHDLDRNFPLHHIVNQ